jgi:hypothetical protein
MHPRTIPLRKSISLLFPCCCWASFTASPLTTFTRCRISPQHQPIQERIQAIGLNNWYHSSRMAPKVVTTAANAANSPDDGPVKEETKRPARKRSAAKVQESTDSAAAAIIISTTAVAVGDTADPPPKKQRAAAPRKASKASEEAGSKESTPKKKASPAHQVLTERDSLPKLWNDNKAAANGSYSKYR